MIKSERLPIISNELLELLVATFRVNTITPETNYNNILYEAGQQSVIQWLQARVNKSDIIRKPQ